MEVFARAAECQTNHKTTWNIQLISPELLDIEMALVGKTSKGRELHRL